MIAAPTSEKKSRMNERPRGIHCESTVNEKIGRPIRQTPLLTIELQYVCTALAGRKC
ncbi:hypothetical protein QVD99_003579 [Batrachochytrium dendrobatidis]|nr:hypothetical protein QVD99_003579 [Batrachochytrium dendrobatidis]